MSFDHLRTTYFDECAELLESAYGQLAALAQSSDDGETVHAVFRAIHSIKGGGGAFGFTRLVGLAHAMETLLDLLRLCDLAAVRVRHGYRRLQVLLRREGWPVNHKRTYRLYAEQGLSIRTKLPRRK